MKLNNEREREIYREAQIATRASVGSFFGTIFGAIAKFYLFLIGLIILLTLLGL